MNRIVRTRLVTAGSAGSGEPHSSFVEADPSVAAAGRRLDAEARHNRPRPKRPANQLMAKVFAGLLCTRCGGSMPRRLHVLVFAHEIIPGFADRHLESKDKTNRRHI